MLSLRETALYTIRYHLGQNPGRNGGEYAVPAEVPALLKLYRDELTDEEVRGFMADYETVRTGQLRMAI